MTSSRGEIALQGFGLHTGDASRVVLRSRQGGVAFRIEGREVALTLATIVGTDRATTLDIGGRQLGTVEHLFAAFGGLGIHGGVSLEVMGKELPLLDGGSRAYCDALDTLDLRPGRPTLQVVREGEICRGDSSYSFERADGVRVEVTVDFGDPRVAAFASWDGDAGDFRERIACARTFAFESDVRALALEGTTTHVSPESVVVLGVRDVLWAGKPFSPDEPARHKLLDLVGDLFFYGGPPRGVVRAHRPGHGATHAVLREALERGIVRTG